MAQGSGSMSNAERKTDTRTGKMPENFDVDDSNYVTVKTGKFTLDNAKNKRRLMIRVLLFLLVIILLVVIITLPILLTQPKRSSSIPTSVISTVSISKNNSTLTTITYTTMTSSPLRISSSTSATTPSISKCPNGFTFIGFDEFNASRLPIPSGYYGYRWINTHVLTPTDHPGSGYMTALGSGQFVAYNSLGKTMSIVNANSSSVDGFSVWSFIAAAAWNEDLVLSITGTYAKATVFSGSFRLQTNIPRHILLDLNNIDNITFTGSGGVSFDGIRDGPFFAIDNLCISTRT